MSRTSLLVMAMLPLLAGCSHRYVFNPGVKVGTIGDRHALHGSTVAFDLAGVPETLETSANGHKYKLSGIRAHASRMLRGLFANERIVEDAAAADRVIAVRSSVEMGAMPAGVRCDVRTQVEILAAGRRLGSGEGQGSSSIPTMGVGGNNCEIASIHALSEGLDAAMGAVPAADGAR